MTKHTQAHITRSLNKKQSSAVLEQTQSQMKYYMSAKLIELGVNPQSAIYRWSVSNKDDQKLWTLSAYWDDSKEKLLSGQIPLTGVDLIDCARANAASGLETTAKLCGYGSSLSTFQEALKQAARQMGVKIESLKDLITQPPYLMGDQGIDVAPDTDCCL
ncbi:MAG: hypothetical protein QNJ60_12990 [Xenococcaceae cyanobacterium MO_188.B19]|nr:hypothetical protein [Xenococcaceae cyanobacterium MO_188.B19]